MALVKYWYCDGSAELYVAIWGTPTACSPKVHCPVLLGPVAHRGGFPCGTGLLLLPVRHLSCAKLHPCLKPKSVR